MILNLTNMSFSAKNITSTRLKLIYFAWIVLLFNQIIALRSPYYATGRYKSSEVNAGKWKEVGTLDLVRLRLHIKSLDSNL